MGQRADPVSARTGAPRLATAEPARRAAPQRGAIWHATQLKAAQSAASRARSGSGLPASLQAGIERLSGLAMDDVQVHRNSPEPAKLGALAYTQGADIHLGPGQERHLPHEAWHVVQQKQGRVQATTQMKGAALNQDPALEREADQMGARAASLPTVGPTPCAPAEAVFPDRAAPAQCAGRASATTAIQGEGVIQLYAAWADVQDAKHKPTANFTEQEKLTIANWCQVQNTNTLRAVHARDYQHNHAETSNNINYVFAFDWDLAIHVDFGGPAHGNVDTPHLQAVRALHGLHGSTQAAIEIAKANAAPAPLGQALPYIDASNAVALTMQQAQACMNANNLDGVKNLIQPKLKAFGEDWARTYADKDSGAKAARAAEDQDVGNLFDEP